MDAETRLRKVRSSSHKRSAGKHRDLTADRSSHAAKRIRYEDKCQLWIVNSFDATASKDGVELVDGKRVETLKGDRRDTVFPDLVTSTPNPQQTPQCDLIKACTTEDNAELLHASFSDSDLFFANIDLPSHSKSNYKSSAPLAGDADNQTEKRRRRKSRRRIWSAAEVNSDTDDLFSDAEIDINASELKCGSHLAERLPSDINAICMEVTDNSHARTKHAPSVSGTKHTSLFVDQVEEKPIDKQISAPSAPTPAGHSVRDRIRKTLRENADRVATPDSRRVRALQEVVVAEALQHAGNVAAVKLSDDPFHDLPSQVKVLFEKHRGINKLYDWQTECLTLAAVQGGENLIYSLPTSGGKSLVADVLMLRKLLTAKRDAVLVLPFVSIVQEKVRDLSVLAVELGFVVEEYAANKGTIPPRKRRKPSLYVATIEKASSLINSLLETSRLDRVGIVVVDELHMLGEGGSRGATLEMLLGRVLHSSQTTQIVGMSATLGNIDEVATFLNATVYSNDFRPVSLQEHVKIEENIYKINPTALCPEDRLTHCRVTMFKYDNTKSKADPDHLAGLVQEVAPQFSCLVFCPTKKNCENVALLLAKAMPRSECEALIYARRTLVSTLASAGGDGSNICNVLRRTVSRGVAYHHSGLTADERRLVETAYTCGTLCVLACTSTLAAGVNLPAKRVILRSPYVGAEFISRSQYKQMVGRAGRAGIDSSGESIVVVQRKDKLKFMELLNMPVEQCHSSLLYEGGKGARRLLLSSIGLGLTPTRSSLQSLLNRTLCHIQSDRMQTNMSSVVESSLQQLVKLALVVEESGGDLKVTDVGRAVYKGGIDTDNSTVLYQDLCLAQTSLVVANHLHMLYLVTPYDLVTQIQPSWMIYYEQMNRLDENELKVANLVGISESFIARKAAGQHVRKRVDDFVVRRFYLTLMLNALWQQKGVWQTAVQFQMSRGFLQQLLNSAAAFAASVSHFCKELEQFWAFRDLLAEFVPRLSHCAAAELLPLLEIPGIKIGRARQFHTAGYRSLQQVAQADPVMLSRQIEFLSRKSAHQIIASAMMLLEEKASALREEAEELLAINVTMPTPTEQLKENLLDSS